MTEKDLEIQQLRRENAELIHRLQMNDAERVKNVQALIKASQEADQYKKQRDITLHDHAELNETIKKLRGKISDMQRRYCANCVHSISDDITAPDVVCMQGVQIKAETILPGNFMCAMWKEDE